MNEKVQSDSEAGAALVETALVVFPFTLLIIAFVEIGMMLVTRCTLEHAAREGARFAITYQTVGGLGHDESIKAVVASQGMGLIGRDNIDVQYFDKDEPDKEVAPPKGNEPDNIVVVSVRRFSMQWMTPFFWGKSPVRLAARAADRMEGLPAGAAPPPR